MIFLFMIHIALDLIVNVANSRCIYIACSCSVQVVFDIACIYCKENMLGVLYWLLVQVLKSRNWFKSCDSSFQYDCITQILKSA